MSDTKQFSLRAPNIDAATVSGFGFEWGKFSQERLNSQDRQRLFEEYFSIFPWHVLPANGGIAADIGCGSGRWALAVAPRVACLHLVDASPAALDVARKNLHDLSNVSFHLASVDNLPFADNSLDSAFSLGVLHHVPDTASAIHSICRKLKPGAPFLVYLYYAFDNRPAWYRLLWRVTDRSRHGISRLPDSFRYLVSQIIAASVYWPLARGGALLERWGKLPANWPLAHYRNASYYVLRTDALDRFGTRLEQRFTRREIRAMLESAGFENVQFADTPPYWCAVGLKARQADGYDSPFPRQSRFAAC